MPDDRCGLSVGQAARRTAQQRYLCFSRHALQEIRDAVQIWASIACAGMGAAHQDRRNTGYLGSGVCYDTSTESIAYGPAILQRDAVAANTIKRGLYGI
ncbi:MAG: hypothetical protein HC828_06325 [Blastochloris sp.]|nr:hypothetical protein [Blastochloris sp.]